jgi:hypothetical protein
LTRFAVKAPVEFSPWDPKRNFFGFATDISAGGAFIETAFPAPPISQLALRIWPWGWGEEVIVASVVRWTGATGMGVQFVSVARPEVLAIRQLVADWPSPRPHPTPR